MYIDINEENNDKDARFRIVDIVRISKCKNNFAKGYVPNFSEQVFLIKKDKNTIPQTFAVSDLNREEIVRTFY